MALSVDLKADMVQEFLSSGFEEEVDYTIKGGASKTIKAIVDRSDPNPQKDVSGRPFPVNGIQITIGSEPLLGIETITEKFDLVSLPLKEGGATKATFRVVKILDQDPGMWHLEAVE